jgi:hypothetical protein
MLDLNFTHDDNNLLVNEFDIGRLDVIGDNRICLETLMVGR